MRTFALSLVSVLALSAAAVPAADAWVGSTLNASLTRYEIRAAIKARKTGQRPASVELPAIAKGGLLFGDPEAATTIVMFTDIQCPFCKRFHQDAYASIKKEFLDKGTVRFVIRHFPWSFHDQARPAAKAVVCARAQGDEKARALYEKLIAAKDLTAGTISSAASSVGLDAGVLGTCATAEKTQKTVDADLKAGGDAKVMGTPAFFIIGPTGIQKPIAGAVPFETFKKAIGEVQKK